jgi:hypothetical protein
MNRFTHNLLKVGAIALVSSGSLALPAFAVAAPATESVTVTAADLQAKADYHAKAEAIYRAWMRTDEKRAMSLFTLANRHYHEAERYRQAAQRVALDTSAKTHL